MASASRIITKVTNAICDTLHNINFPDDLNTVKEGFYRIANFPNIVGAIDGTLIPIQGMSGEEEPNFVCRKGFHAINCQGIVDANLR